MKTRLFLGAVIASSAVVVGMVAAAPIASADPSSPATQICPTAGTAVRGNYHNLVIHKNAYVGNHSALTVRGSLIIGRGGCFDAFSRGTVRVAGNVIVEPGATLALGCAPGSNGPPGIAPCYFTTTSDWVGGSIIADRPLTMYLTAIKVRGSVISYGGGPGAQSVGTSFPVKSMHIHGNLIMAGWRGGWIGALRNTVDGSVIVADNVGSRQGENGTPDSTEVVGNTIGRNLICFHNTPTARYGDAYAPAQGNGPNVVAGHAIGECASLTVPPPAS